MFKWKELNSEKKIDDIKIENEQSNEQTCSFCNVHNPGCTKRLSDKELKLCWDIMNEMKLQGDKFVYNNKEYYLMYCKKCEYPYIIEIYKDSFICEDCK